MSRYRKIDVRIWNDEKFRSLSADAKLIFIFILTHPGMTSLGAMRATVPGMAAELGTLSKGFREGFGELLRKGLIECDNEAAYVGIPKFLKYNGPENPNVVKSWATALDLIPECRLKPLLLNRARECAEALGEGFAKGLPEPFRKGMPNPEQEQEQEQELIPDEKSGPKNSASKPAKKKRTSVFSWLNAEDLRDVAKLIEWHRRASRAPNPVIGQTDQDRLNVVSAAVKSWDKADDPVKLFAWIIGNKRWDTIREVDEDTAHRLIKQHLAGGAAAATRKGGTSSSAEIIADLFPETGVSS